MVADEDKENINVVVIGHVDSGKSTTCGKLMQHLSKIDPRLIAKYGKEAEEMGKGSFQFAWVMDKLKAERERGITIKETLNQMFTDKRKVTLIDAPGHRDFIKNMITGAAQADCAVLIVSAATGEFEAGISKNGQTREHAMLASTLGIKDVIVPINKMDTINYEEKRFTEIKKEVTSMLTGLGVRKKRITFIPISGFHGENLIEHSEKMAWYKGPTLKAAIDTVPVPKRPVDSPLRMVITSVYKIGGVGMVVGGRVETGVVKPGQMIDIQPGNLSSKVQSIEMHHTAVEQAIPGDNVGINLKNLPKNALHRGQVMGDSKEKPPKVAETFLLRLVFTAKGTMKVGYSPVFFAHASHFPGAITEIKESIDKRTGETVETNPEFLSSSQGSGKVIIKPTKEVVLEEFKEFPQLGRVSIRDGNATKAVGIVESITHKKVPAKRNATKG